MAERSETDSDLMRLVRERYDAAVDADRDNRDRDENDRLFYTGGEGQWPKGVPKERFDEGRPCQTFNRLPQFVKQVSGEIRQNKPAIKVLPVDGQTDREVANVYSAIIRHIEGSSEAHRIYANETEKAVIGGCGWWRVKSAYCDDADFDQDLGIEGIANPNSVACDPDARSVTRSDMKFCFVTELVSKKRFEKDYPDCTPNDFSSDGTQGWVQGEFVRIAEYWEKNEVGKQSVFAVVLPQGNVENRSEDEILAMAKDAKLIGDDEKADVRGLLDAMGLQIKAERKVPRYEVRSRVVTGSDPLGPWQAWPGKYIPIIRVVGEEVAAGDTIFRHGLIHHAKSAQIGYNYARNAMMERHATSARAPWLATLKMIAPFKGMWERANSSNPPVLLYDPDPKAPTLRPERTAPPQLDAAAYQESLVASEDMKAATGIYDAALGAKSNETSGVAIARRDAQGDTATYVYIDNMEASIAHTGRVLIDLIPHYYDDSRIIRLLGEDEEIEKFVEINKIMPDGKSWNDVTRGKYDVVVTTGPAYASKRAEAADRLTDLVAKFPALQQLGGDLVMKALDVPYADKLADRLAMTLPPGMDEEADKKRAEQQQAKGPPPPSPEQQAMQAEQEQAAAKLDMQAKESEAKLQIQQRESEAKIQMLRAELAAKQDLALADFRFKSWLAAQELGLDRDAAAHEATLDIANAAHGAMLDTATVAHSAQLNEAAQEHSQGLDEEAAENQGQAE